jgi:signal transduction histidine kinase
MPLQRLIRAILDFLQAPLLPLLTLLAIAVAGTYFYLHGQQVMVADLRQKLQTSATLASLQFNAADIAQVNGPADEKKPAYKRLVSTLDAIRASIPNIRYGYVMRRTSDATRLKFIADADGLKTPKELDANGNGIIDTNEKARYPGDTYDVSHVAVLQHNAFLHASVDPGFTKDQWGTWLFGYAPILDAKGNAIAIVGLGMEASDFIHFSRSVFSPLAYALLLLVGVLIAFFISSALNRRRIQALKQLDSERTEMLDLATHQLGMPLATFRWWLELLREQDAKNSSKKKMYDELEEGVKRMDGVIDSLRATGRLQAGTHPYAAVRVSLKSVINDAARDTMSMLRRRSQHLTVNLSKLPTLTLDRSLVRGVLKELIENASFYSPARSSIVIRGRKAGRRVVIEVEDHGYGIPSKDQSRIFERFTRGSNAAHYKPAGNGMGLFIARTIIERAHGSIGVRSTLGKGSTFTITLPLS